MPQADVLIIGAGLAGLCCARHLHAAGVSFLLLDAADRVGGRVRTDVVEGYLLDRGFQVLLTSYPEAQKQLDFNQLELKHFSPGALVHMEKEFFLLSDPWREPSSALSTLSSPVGTLPDKLRIARLRADVTSGPVEALFDRPETTTREALQNHGLSATIIDQFFRPFLGGILLDGSLTASSRMFEFAFRMMSEGRASLPARGMQAIPDQLASGLPQSQIQLNTRVLTLTGTRAILESGEEIEASQVIIATDGPQASLLAANGASVRMRGVHCLYFAAPEPPIAKPILVLNGEHRGYINNLCFPSVVAPAYAPRHQTLVSVTVLDAKGLPRETLMSTVHDELREWFGPVAGGWRPLAHYRIDLALPAVSPLRWMAPSLQVRNNVWVCGDHCATPSIQGAMESGRVAAEQLLAASRV